MSTSKTLSLEAQVRDRIGSSAAATIRKEGRIPAIMYGHRQEPIAISLDAHDFVEGIHHGHRLIDINVDGKTQTALIKALQYDHLGRNVIHADLMRVDVTEVIKVTVPLEMKGVPKGAKEGGVIEAHMGRLEVQCLAVNIPEVIVVSVKDLEVGQEIHASEVQLPDGVTLASPADMIVAACRIVAEVKTTEQVEAETPVAPEVIGAEKEAEEAPEEEQK